MTVDQALARLRLNVQPSSYPTLAEQELVDILAIYAVPDADGILPDELGWVGTWDITAASRKGWLVKAAKAVGDVNYNSDGSQTSLSDIHAHCMAQADRYHSVGSLRAGAYS
jgi:hypothetical protein